MIDGAPGMGIEEFMSVHKPRWMTNPDRNCAKSDTSLFFDGTARAVGICLGCPEERPCLQWAIDNNERGVWGGTSERQRRRLRKVPK